MRKLLLALVALVATVGVSQATFGTVTLTNAVKVGPDLLHFSGKYDPPVVNNITYEATWIKVQVSDDNGCSWEEYFATIVGRNFYLDMTYESQTSILVNVDVLFDNDTHAALDGNVWVYSPWSSSGNQLDTNTKAYTVDIGGDVDRYSIFWSRPSTSGGSGGYGTVSMEAVLPADATDIELLVYDGTANDIYRSDTSVTVVSGGCTSQVVSLTREIQTYEATVTVKVKYKIGSTTYYGTQTGLIYPNAFYSVQN